jgi:hypothetical protein
MNDENIVGNHRNLTGMIHHRTVVEIRKRGEGMEWRRGGK